MPNRRTNHVGPEPHYRVREVAEARGVKPDIVLSWIHAGQLSAVDMSCKQAKRPRWRIADSALAEFDAMRRAAVAAPAVRRVRRRKDPRVIEFFK